MVGEAEVGLGVVVADVGDHAGEEAFVVGEFSVFDVLADDVAEEAAEVFVAREGEERAGIGEHADEVGEEADGGEGVDLVFHALEAVVEPPTGAELDFPLVRSFLEGAASAGEDGVVAGIEVVDDGFGKLVDPVEGVEEDDEGFALWPVADGVEAGVGSELLEEAGVGVPSWSEVELHRPVVFSGPLSNVEHDEGAEGVGFGAVGGGTGEGIAENAVGFGFRAGVCEGVAHSVVGEAAAFLVEVVEAFFEDF